MSSDVVSIVTGRRWAPRADPRHEMEAIGNLTNSARQSIGCLVEDISHGGAKICAAEQVLAGEQLRLSIPEFNFVAPVTLVWAKCLRYAAKTQVAATRDTYQRVGQAYEEL